MFKTEIKLTVLSEHEISFGTELESIIWEGDHGAFVIDETRQPAKRLTGLEMARALREAGSTPDFFELDDDGNDID